MRDDRDNPIPTNLAEIVADIYSSMYDNNDGSCISDVVRYDCKIGRADKWIDFVFSMGHGHRLTWPEGCEIPDKWRLDR